MLSFYRLLQPDSCLHSPPSQSGLGMGRGRLKARKDREHAFLDTGQGWGWELGPPPACHCSGYGPYHLYWKKKLPQEGAGGEEPGGWEEEKGEEQEEAKMTKTEKP